MLRSLIGAGFLAAALARGAIFPDQIGSFKKGPARTVSVADVALYDEYGFDGTEQAGACSGAASRDLDAHRFR